MRQIHDVGQESPDTLPSRSRAARVRPEHMGSIRLAARLVDSEH